MFSPGSDSDKPGSQPPQERQPSRKERRKRLRELRQRQKQEHQRARKRGRVEQIFKLEEKLQGRKQERREHMAENEPVSMISRHAAALEQDESQLGDSDSVIDTHGASADSISIGGAAGALKEQQQRPDSDRLQAELQLLEKRLGIRNNGRDSEEARARRKQKIRQELSEDGFDLELQDILDQILVCLEWHPPLAGCSFCVFVQSISFYLFLYIFCHANRLILFPVSNVRV